VDLVSGHAVVLSAMDGLVRDTVLKPFDNANLNTQVPQFRGDVVPTTENLSLEITRRIQDGWRAIFPSEWPKLEKICIVETPRNIFEVLVDA
jgi:6-pyruvoyl-tetrahydropterin synthase